jgi:phenol hydroxylase P3 protein
MRALLEEDERNLPILQDWLDKWTWRLYRVDALAGSIFFDYFAKNKVMSYKEAFQKYFVDDFIGGLVNDLGRYGLKEPRFIQEMLDEMDVLSHLVWKYLYQRKKLLWFKVFQPDDEDIDWLKDNYPGWQELVGEFWDDVRAGKVVDYGGLVPICSLCHTACLFHTPDRPKIQGPFQRDGRTLWFCSPACKWIFEREPEKYLHDRTIGDLAIAGRVPEDPEEFLRFSGISDPSLGGDLYIDGNGANGSESRRRAVRSS